MDDLDLTREHMEIVGSDGQHVAVFLRLRAGALELAAGRAAEAPRLPLALVESVDTVIRLKAPAREIIAKWLARRSDAYDGAPTTS